MKGRLQREAFPSHSIFLAKDDPNGHTPVTTVTRNRPTPEESLAFGRLR